MNPPRSALAPLGVFASLWVANPRKGRLSPAQREIEATKKAAGPNDPTANKKSPSGAKPKGLK